MSDRFATFERDLANIERARVAANTKGTPARIEEKFSRVFAGAGKRSANREGEIKRWSIGLGDLLRLLRAAPVHRHYHRHDMPIR